ncbi:MAG: hypothetical protein ACLVKO_01350 [Dysgonomonas sp.]
MKMAKKKPKTNKKKKVTANKYNIVNQFSLRGIKDKNKQRTLLQNRISELEKELKERKEQLDKVNEELFEEDIKKITEKYSKEKIIKALEQ